MIQSILDDDTDITITCLKCKFVIICSQNELDIYNVPDCSNCITIDRDKKIDDLLNG